MKRLGVSPKLSDFSKENPIVNDWFFTITGRFKVYSGAADPTVAEVPQNQWIVYNNTTVPEVRIWTNIAGVLKKSAAFV
jgi:hypothetical protein